MANLILETESLNQGRIKINTAIEQSEQAVGISSQANTVSGQALTKANEALSNSEDTQNQLNTIVINGDSSVEAAQARVAESGVAFTTLKERLDDSDSHLSGKANKGELYLSVRDYGAKGDGVTDDTQAFKDALSAASTTCSNVLVPPTANGYLIAGDSITIPLGVALYGAKSGNNSSFISINTGSVLLITGNATIVDESPVFIMQTGSEFRELSIVYPNQTVTNPPIAYPYLIRGATSVCNDTLVKNVYLYNCYQFADFTGAHSRVTFNNIAGNILYRGINIDNSFDVDRFEDIHFYPFFSTGDEVLAYTTNNAKGIILGRADGFQANNLFFYGLATCVELGNATNPVYGQITNLSCDVCKIGINAVNVWPYGVSIKNFKYAMSPTRQATYGLPATYAIVLSNPNGNIDIDGISIWGGPNRFLYVNAAYGAAAKTRLTNIDIIANVDTEFISHSGLGTIIIENLHSTLSKNLVGYGASASSIIFENPQVVLENSAGTQKSIIKKYNIWDASVSNIVAASTLTLPNSGDFFNVTGVTWIASITASKIGRIVVLKFSDASKVVAGSNLKIVSDFATTANDTLTLVCDGTNWYELCRSANIA